MNGISSREKRSTASRESDSTATRSTVSAKPSGASCRGTSDADGAVAAAEAFNDAVAQFESGFTNALQNQFAATARLGHRISPDDRERSRRPEAIAKRGADFKHLGARLAGRTAYSNTIVAEIFNGQRRGMKPRHRG